MPNSIPAQESLMTSADLAAWWHLSRRTVCFWAEVGEIPGFKVGSQWRFQRSEMEEWWERAKFPLGMERDAPLVGSRGSSPPQSPPARKN